MKILMKYSIKNLKIPSKKIKNKNKIKNQKKIQNQKKIKSNLEMNNKRQHTTIVSDKKQYNTKIQITYIVVINPNKI